MTDGDDALAEARQRRKRALLRDHGFGAPPAPVYVDGSRNFEQTVAAHEVVVVHYYASGGTGRRLHPIVEDVARETVAAVAKVNVVYHQKLATEQGVEGTPTFDVFAGGERQERIEGSVEQAELVELVEEYAD